MFKLFLIDVRDFLIALAVLICLPVLIPLGAIGKAFYMYFADLRERSRQ